MAGLRMLVVLRRGRFVEVPLLGRGGVPTSGVGAVVANVTAANPSAAGFATVYPCGARPEASSLNYLPGPTTATANEVIAKLSALGSVCVYSFAETDLLIDVVGYVASTSSPAPPTPPSPPDVPPTTTPPTTTPPTPVQCRS